MELHYDISYFLSKFDLRCEESQRQTLIKSYTQCSWRSRDIYTAFLSSLIEKFVVSRNSKGLSALIDLLLDSSTHCNQGTTSQNNIDFISNSQNHIIAFFKDLIVLMKDKDCTLQEIQRYLGEQFRSPFFKNSCYSII